jgi:hypothetical protein
LQSQDKAQRTLGGGVSKRDAGDNVLAPEHLIGAATRNSCGAGTDDNYNEDANCHGCTFVEIRGVCEKGDILLYGSFGPKKETCRII